MPQLLLILLFCFSLSASTLHLATSANPSRINPILATDSSSSEIAGFIFNGLVKYDKDANEIIGDLAESYRFENNTTLIFELRDNVRWQDGRPFTADDVVFTYNIINSPKVVSPYTSTFRMVESVVAVDPLSVKVVYKEPYFKALETWMMGILPKHLLENEKDMMSAGFNTAPVGTGPYRLSKLEFSKNIELVANDDYFEHRPYIDKISFHVIADPMTRFLMLKSGELDIGSLEAMQMERQLDSAFFKRFDVIEDISHSYTYLGFNLRLEKFKDSRVRKALSLAVNREELVDILFLKHGRECSGPFLPGGPSFNEDVKVPKQNIERAKELLKEAGYSSEQPLTFEIATSNSSSIRPYAAQIVQHQLAKIGVEVTLRVMEWQAFLNMVVFPRKFETVLLGWSLSLSPDPYLLWHSDNDKPGAFNFIGYNNISVDRLIEKMQYTVDRNRLSEIQQKIFADIVVDDPYLFLYIPNSITVVNRSIKNVEPSLNGIWHNFIDWKKEEPVE
ncbi:MAG: peptide-binding protein [Campylobacterota bacterium]|nr:peptide-binding protein [Campylobacterota bacterium]